jgi:hypothetical protein
MDCIRNAQTHSGPATTRQTPRTGHPLSTSDTILFVTGNIHFVSRCQFSVETPVLSDVYLLELHQISRIDR